MAWFPLAHSPLAHTHAHPAGPGFPSADPSVVTTCEVIDTTVRSALSEARTTAQGPMLAV
jgi:hypothetical protein